MSFLLTYSELRVFCVGVVPTIIGEMGFLPSSMLMLFSIIGLKSRILGYKSSGLMVPLVRITEGKLFQMGFMDKEQSRHAKVRSGYPILPSIGVGWNTILKPFLCMNVS